MSVAQVGGRVAFVASPPPLLFLSSTLCAKQFTWYSLTFVRYFTPFSFALFPFLCPASSIPLLPSLCLVVVYFMFCLFGLLVVWHSVWVPPLGFYSNSPIRFWMCRRSPLCSLCRPPSVAGLFSHSPAMCFQRHLPTSTRLASSRLSSSL
jgi:hypothetical protein